MAHPPQDLNVNFDLEDKMLTVEVTHNVGGSNTNHYVEEIIITTNDEDIIIQKPGQQLNNKEIFYYYMPGIKEGDELEITTICSVQGEINAPYKVSASSED